MTAGVTRKAMVYFSQETQQSWQSCSDTLNAKSQQDEEGDVDGGALWLPGNVILELQMLPMVCCSHDMREAVCTCTTSSAVLCLSITICNEFLALPKWCHITAYNGYSNFDVWCKGLAFDLFCDL